MANPFQYQSNQIHFICWACRNAIAQIKPNETRDTKKSLISRQDPIVNVKHNINQSFYTTFWHLTHSTYSVLWYSIPESKWLQRVVGGLEPNHRFTMVMNHLSFCTNVHGGGRVCSRSFWFPFCTLLFFTSLGNRQYVHTKVFIGFFPLFFLYVNFVPIICCCKGIGIPCRMCRVLDAIWPVSSSFSMKWKSVCKECMWLALVWALKWLASLVHHWKNWIFDCQESQVGTKIALNYFHNIYCYDNISAKKYERKNVSAWTKVIFFRRVGKVLSGAHSFER